MRTLLWQSLIAGILAFTSVSSHALYYVGSSNDIFVGARQEEARIKIYSRQLTDLTADIQQKEIELSKAKQVIEQIKEALRFFTAVETRHQMGIETHVPTPLIGIILGYLAPSTETQIRQEINALKQQQKLLLSTQNEITHLKGQSSIKLKQMYSCMAIAPHALFFRHFGEAMIRNPKLRDSVHKSPLVQAVIGSFLAVGSSCTYNLYPLYKYGYGDNNESKAPIHMINGVKTCVIYLILDMLSYLHKTGKLTPMTSRLPVDQCKNIVTETYIKYRDFCDSLLRAHIPRYIRYKNKLKRAGRRLQRLTSKISLTPAKREWALKTACSSWLAQEYVKRD